MKQKKFAPWLASQCACTFRRLQIREDGDGALFSFLRRLVLSLRGGETLDRELQFLFLLLPLRFFLVVLLDHLLLRRKLCEQLLVRNTLL